MSLAPLHEVVFTTARLALTPLEREAADAFCAALRDAALDDVLYVAGALLDDGDWRPWMLPALLQLQRGSVVELLRRLGPLVTAARRRAEEEAEAVPVVVGGVVGVVDKATVNERVRRRRVPISDPCSPFDATT